MNSAFSLKRLRDLRRSRIIQNIGWLAASYAIAKPLWFVFITAACMRLLAPDDYGIFTASLALAILTSSVADLGTARYTTREVARRPAIASRLFSNVLIGRIGLAVLGLLAAVAIGFVLGYPSDHMASVVGAGVYALAFRGAEYCRSFFQAFEVLRYEAILTVLEKFAVVGGGMLTLWWYRTPSMAFAGMAAGMIVVLGVNVWWVHHRLAPLQASLLRPRYLSRIIRSAIPLGLIGMLSIVPIGATPVIVEAMLGREAAGFYGGAQRIVEGMWLLITVVAVAVFPRFSSLYHNRQLRDLRQLFSTTLIGALFIGCAAAVMASVLSHEIIFLLTGSNEYEFSGTILSYLSWSFPFACIWMVTLQMLISVNDHKFATLSSLMGAIICIILCIVLIPFIGIWGAVVGYISVWVATSITNTYRCYKLIWLAPSHHADIVATR